jgi:hypothetical protein
MPPENGKTTAEPNTASQLRAKIDRGETGDKVAASDPAAAPLGTDAEAGGFSPTSEQVKLAIEEETKPVSPNPTGPEQAMDAYFVKPNPVKTAIMFAVTTALVVITVWSVYAYWPREIP